jgi:hypothetical protein
MVYRLRVKLVKWLVRLAAWIAPFDLLEKQNAKGDA